MDTFNHVNNPWSSALSIKQLTEPVTSEGYEIFPSFKLRVMVLFSDSLMYIQKNSVCLGPFPNHRPPWIPALSTVSSVGSAEEDETVREKDYLLIIMIHLSSWGGYL